MEKNGIRIDPLHGHALKKLPGIGSKPGDVHFSKEGYDYLAEKVAEVIGERLGR
ncbi:MAG: hypothetical protein O3A87_07650 [Verrucomicrobia bacterium]|nr:hypothetical protein [Verrucomicrobiota bacterium]